MQITNTKYYHAIDFDAYLAMPGVSFSGLKDIPVPQSAGVSLGSRVHQYILEPTTYDWTDAGVVKKIAEALRKYMGASLSVLDKEIAFTCDMHHNGMVLPYKGRADMLKIGRIVVDFKILAGGVLAAAERFGYDSQISGYCLATGCPQGLIVAWNKQRKIVETRLIHPDATFWEYQVVRLGRPAECKA